LPDNTRYNTSVYEDLTATRGIKFVITQSSDHSLILGYKTITMKKMMLIIGCVAVISGCNSSDKKKTEDTKTDSQVGVQNANGNIPDTTNAIKLSTDVKESGKMSKDSVK